MEDSVIARRADDLVISVRQDNDAQSVSISGINERALALLGFDNTQSVVGASLYSILDPRTKDIVSSYLEFTDDGTDLSEVVSKIRGFTLLNSKLQPVSVRPKIFRTTSSLLNYEILIRDTSLSQKLDEFRAGKLQENARYTMHESFGIMDEASTATEIGVVLDFANSGGVNAIICMIAADPTAHSSGSSLAEMLDRTLSDTIRKTSGTRTFLGISESVDLCLFFWDATTPTRILRFQESTGGYATSCHPVVRRRPQPLPHMLRCKALSWRLW